MEANAHSGRPFFQSILVGGKIQEDLDLKDNSTAKDDLLAQASPPCLSSGSILLVSQHLAQGKA